LVKPGVQKFFRLSPERLASKRRSGHLRVAGAASTLGILMGVDAE
jgi:hypothetical protein